MISEVKENEKKITGSTLCYSYAVSYTHLDVYKRQVENLVEA